MTKLHTASTSCSRLRATLASAAVLLFLVSGAGSMQPVRAATSPPAPATSAPSTGAGRVTFGIKPSHATLKLPIDARSRFDYTATPGAQQPDYVAVSNSALTTLHLSVYASDGFNTASDGFDLLPASKKPVDVGSWITLKTNVIDIAPRATVVIPFLVQVPAKVTPGDHVGGIVVSLRTFGVDKKGDRVAIDQRVGTRVYLRIQGPLDPRVTLNGLTAKYRGSWWNPFAAGKVTVSYTIRNPGNVRLGVHQALDVSGMYGTAHSLIPPDVPELLPDNSHAEQFVITGVTPSFRGRAHVALTPFSLPGDTDGRLSQVSMSASFWAVPWALVALLALLLLLFLAWYANRRRRRRPKSPAETSGPARKSAEVQP